MKDRPFLIYVLIESAEKVAFVGSITCFFLMLLAAAGKVAGVPLVTQVAFSFFNTLFSRGSPNEVSALMANFVAGPATWLVFALACSTVSKLLSAVLRGLAERERQLQEGANNLAA